MTQLRHKLSLAFDHIASSTDADAILEHAAGLVRDRDERSPILRLVAGSSSSSSSSSTNGRFESPFEIAILYSVDGSIVRSKATFASLHEAPLTVDSHGGDAAFPICPLQDITKADHDAAARTGGRNVRYVVLWRRSRNGAPSAALAFASSADLEEAATKEQLENAEALRLFRHEDKKKSEGEDEDTAGPADEDGETMMLIAHVDAARCHITGPPVVRLLARPSVALEAIERTAAELAANPALVSPAAVERCMVQAAGWVADTMRAIDARWAETVGEAQAALKLAQRPLERRQAGGGDPAALAGIRGGLALHLVEGLLKRHGALQALETKLRDTSGPFAALLAKADAASEVQQQWLVRVARLTSELELARSEAASVSVLSPSLLAIKLHRCETTPRGIDALRDVADRLAVHLLLAVAILDKALERDETDRRVTTAFFVQTLLPVVASDFVAAVERALMLEKIFQETAEGTAGDGNASSETGASAGNLEKRAPMAASEAVRARMVESAGALRGWAAAYRRVGLALRHPCYELQRRWVSVSDTDEWAMAAFEKSPAHDVLYAADRCMDIHRYLGQIERAGLGLQTPQVRCLFATLDEAAAAFPLLRSGQHRNWSVVAEKFDRSLTLQYTAVDKKTVYTALPLPSEEDVSGVAAGDQSVHDSSMSTSGVSPARSSAVNASSVTETSEQRRQHQQQSTESLEAEHSVLSLRVAQLTEELREARHTLRTSAADVRALKGSLAKVLEDNDELRRSLSVAIVDMSKLKAVMPLEALQQLQGSPSKSVTPQNEDAS